MSEIDDCENTIESEDFEREIARLSGLEPLA